MANIQTIDDCKAVKVKLYNAYTDGRIDRKTFMERNGQINVKWCKLLRESE